MADLLRQSLVERDADQAILALKKGAFLLKYGRRGKPKFCPFRLSTDESKLIWYYGQDEQQLDLRQISRIIPGQRTAIFQRYPRPEKEYQSFSLIYSDRSLDLICKDKEEAEVWFVALKALIARNGSRKSKYEGKAEIVSSDGPLGQKNSPSSSFDFETPRLEKSRLGKVFADIVSHTATSKNASVVEAVGSSFPGVTENSNGQYCGADNARVSLCSAVSSSSQGSSRDDFDSLGDVYIWGEGTGKGMLGGGQHRVGQLSSTHINANTPKIVDSTMLLDALSVACGNRHAILVNKLGEVFSWGEETEGRLGHGVETDLSQPKLIETLMGKDIKMVACGDYHTCAITLSGDLYTWGDGFHNLGLLGHEGEVSHWIPRKINGLFDSLQVSYISCGPWHTALITSAGRLFSFGDGTFGALGHGDQNSTRIPRELDALKGHRTLRVACGVWHTAAVVQANPDLQPSDGFLFGKLFTWGDGDKGQLGHGDNASRLAPHCVTAYDSLKFSQVACGHSLTVALAISGQVYTMGSTINGQLGNPVADGKTPLSVEGDITESFIEDISCGLHHVAVLTSKSEVYTWGKGSNGQLGHGDYDDRSTPVLVEFLKNKVVKSVVCGSNFTAAISLRKVLSGADNSVCSGCQNTFNFRRKRHNCYNCGFAFCKACSDRKSLNASLAPSPNKAYRVCDDCFAKLQKCVESGSSSQIPKARNRSTGNKSMDVTEETGGLQSHGNFFRLSSFASSNLDKNKSFGSRSIVSPSKVSPHVLSINENIQRNSISSSKSTSDLKRNHILKLLSVPSPTSRTVSTLESPPITQNTSPVIITTTSIDPHKEKLIYDLEHSNDALSEEIKYLRAQVEELSSKSQFIEEELQRKSQKLKEAEAKAAEESKKTKAAKEAIKSLTSKLKERCGKVSITNTEHMSKKNLYHSSDRARVTTNQASSSSESTINPVFSNGTKNPMHSSDRARATTSRASSTNENTVNPVFSNGTKTQVHSSERTSMTTGQASSTSKRLFSNGTEALAHSPDRDRITTRHMSSASLSTPNPVFPSGTKTQVHTSDRARAKTIQTTYTHEGTVNPVFSMGSKIQLHMSELLIKEDPGVYIIVSPLPGGKNELRRVRFSRKHFSEKYAQTWWSENEKEVYQRHNIISQ